MTISGIKDNVQSLLTNSGYFVDVLSNPPTSDADFTGYPSAAHYYVNTQSDYATVSQNRRVIEYLVELYLQADSVTTKAEELAQAYALIDNVLDLFDKSIDLSDATISLSRACDILRPAPGELQRVQLQDGNGFYMPIHLYCEADVSFLA